MQIKRASYLVWPILAGLIAMPLWGSGEDGPENMGSNIDALDPDPIVLAPEEIEWGEGPPSIPAGTQAAVIEGDPSAEGELFVFRIRIPPNYTLPPHFHPEDERVTVISGTFHLGMGRTFDRARGRALPAGSQFLMPPGHAHYAWTEGGEAVIQLTSVGPWAIEYVDPADDPRGAAGAE